ncbi:hypothetical protein [Knoellia sinensis]|uniref:hypothetical protein n=1 Tax=Knoellia sinensis TaxID=136100 RepID=UPI000B0B9E00|nr:hypothetical protein [Knoellia sinensis]
MSAPVDGADQAQVLGILTRNDQGCLVLDQGPPDHVPVVWPEGTVPLLGDDTLDGVRLPSGTEVRVGQSLQGGGGYSTLKDVTLGSGDPAKCGFGEGSGAAMLSSDPVSVSTPSASPTS